MLALLDGPDFRNGTIQLQVAGRAPARDAAGFTRIHRRQLPHRPSRCLVGAVLPPAHQRKIRRSATAQSFGAVCVPSGVSRHRLRQEKPGVYESYADLVSGEWTAMRIEVAGTKARLYLNGATQPCLVINDLKHGDRPGRIALWAHVETDAYFGPVAVGR